MYFGVKLGAGEILSLHVRDEAHTGGILNVNRCVRNLTLYHKTYIIHLATEGKFPIKSHSIECKLLSALGLRRSPERCYLLEQINTAAICMPLTSAVICH